MTEKSKENFPIFRKHLADADARDKIRNDERKAAATKTLEIIAAANERGK